MSTPEQWAFRSGRVIFSGALLGALGVLAGAYGAHGLEASPEQLGWWRTAVLYHLVHAPAIVGAGLLHARSGWGATGGGMLVIGTAVFSGTLYAMALGGPRWLGAVTPVGGFLLVLGWLALALAGVRASRSR